MPRCTSHGVSSGSPAGTFFGGLLAQLVRRAVTLARQGGGRYQGRESCIRRRRATNLRPATAPAASAVRCHVTTKTRRALRRPRHASRTWAMYCREQGGRLRVAVDPRQPGPREDVERERRRSRGGRRPRNRRSSYGTNAGFARLAGKLACRHAGFSLFGRQPRRGVAGGGFYRAVRSQQEPLFWALETKNFGRIPKVKKSEGRWSFHCHNDSRERLLSTGFRAAGPPECLEGTFAPPTPKTVPRALGD
jgi:hypothetical protein